MASIAYLRDRLAALAEPAEYRLFVDPAQKAALDAAQVELEEAIAERGRLLSLVPEQRRTRSVAQRSPLVDADARIERAEAAVAEAEEAAEVVVLRWMPHDPDKRHEWLAALHRDAGRVLTERDVYAAEAHETFAGAFAADGTRYPDTWADLAPLLNDADHARIYSRLRDLNDRAHEHPFPRVSSGRPATSSNPA